MSNYIRKWLFPKSLSREVLDVFAASPAIKKLGRNDAENYDFVMIETICREFKGEVFQRGVFIAATDLDCVFEEIPDGEGVSVARCTVRTKFEARRKRWFGMQRFDMGEALGSGVDQFDHIALAIAQTFAFKAMLKRSSMTYGVKDDPEMPRKTGPKSYRERALDAALRKVGVSEEVLAHALGQKGGAVNYEEILKLSKKDFDQAIKLILGMEDLTGKLSTSVANIQSQKAQRVVSIMDRKPTVNEIA